ncbi:hypothetical protein D3C71_485710 [compost metagenome]
MQGLQITGLSESSYAPHSGSDEGQSVAGAAVCTGVQLAHFPALLPYSQRPRARQGGVCPLYPPGAGRRPQCGLPAIHLPLSAQALLHLSDRHRLPGQLRHAQIRHHLRCGHGAEHTRNQQRGGKLLPQWFSGALVPADRRAAGAWPLVAEDRIPNPLVQGAGHASGGDRPLPAVPGRRRRPLLPGLRLGRAQQPYHRQRDSPLQLRARSLSLRQGYSLRHPCPLSADRHRCQGGGQGRQADPDVPGGGGDGPQPELLPQRLPEADQRLHHEGAGSRLLQGRALLWHRHRGLGALHVLQPHAPWL